MRPEGAQQDEWQGEGEECLRPVPARPVDSELVGVLEEGRRSDQAVSEEPKLIVELQRVARGAGEDCTISGRGGDQGKGVGHLHGQGPGHDEPNDEEERGQPEPGSDS